jgi:glycosyl transferase family 2
MTSRRHKRKQRKKALARISSSVERAGDLGRAEKALSENDAQALREELTALFPNQLSIEQTRKVVQFALSDAASPPSAAAPEQMFVESIAETKRLLRGAPLPGVKHTSISAELDFLCDTGGVDSWSIPQCLNFLLLSRIRPRRRSVVVGAMRDDGIYILEWVAHYLALGFDHVIVYTNDNSDGSEELLRLLAEHSVITLVESEISGTVPPESKAFGHALHLLHDLRDFEWALFVDSDEYFVPAPRYGNSVASVLAAVKQRFPEKPASGICYDWLWFISGMAYKRTPPLLLERFQHAVPHHLTKCLARIRDVVSMRRDHFAELKGGGVLVDSVFDPVDPSSISPGRIPQYGGGRINHYWARSFEEFAIKRARGASLNLDENLYDRPFSTFFAWNGFESPQNRYPVDPVLLGNVKRKIEELEALDGVRAAATKINLNFPHFLKRVASNGNLRKLYQDAKTEPEL